LRRALPFVPLVLLVAACTPKKKDDPAPGEAPSASASVMAAPAPAPKQSAPPPPLVQDPPKQTRIGSCAANGEKRFTLVHFNDLQARYSDRIAGRSRYAHLAGYLRATKADKPETLVLDAGDDYEKGALAELRSGGETTRKMVQALPIDVRTIGNHDFAYGEKAVLADVTGSSHPVLAANIDHPAFKPYTALEVGCVKVGIIGLVTQGFGSDDNPTNEPYCGVFKQDEHYIAIMQKEIDAHRAEVDVMIALTHLGYSDDSVLASRAKGLDLIVGGHSEDFVEHPASVKHADGKKTLIVQAGNYAKKVGRGEVVVGPSGISLTGYRLVPVDAKMPVAEDVDALAKKLEDEAVPDAHKPIGRVRAPLQQHKDMADLVRRAAVQEWEADVVIVGRDLFFSGLDRGEVTLQRLYDATLVQREPSGTNGFSSLWTLELSGDDLAALAKRTMVSWRYDPTYPPKIDAKKTYRVIIDKRALFHPGTYLGGGITLPQGTYRGEIIDLLEQYARARSAKNLTID
jgi:5'-nucleotidase / UDP-sugar diphosphatase